MIQLDEHHWVKSADEVSAIRPVYIPPPDAITDPNRRDAIIDPERCAVLISGIWLTIERGGDAVARVLRESKPRT